MRIVLAREERRGMKVMRGKGEGGEEAKEIKDLRWVIAAGRPAGGEGGGGGWRRRRGGFGAGIEGKVQK